MNDNVTICKRCGKGFTHGQKRRVYCSQSCYLQVVKEPSKEVKYVDTSIKTMIIVMGVLIVILMSILVYEYYKKPVTIEDQLNEKFEVYIENYFRDRD